MSASLASLSSQLKGVADRQNPRLKLFERLLDAVLFHGPKVSSAAGNVQRSVKSADHRVDVSKRSARTEEDKHVPSMNQSVRLICPSLRCRAILSVPTDVRGKTIRCRSCGTRVKVPANLKPTPGAPTTAAPQQPADQSTPSS